MKKYYNEGPTFELWGGSRVPGSWPHFYTMPKHKVCTVNKHKKALNRDDDKRLVQADGITTLAWGYVALSA